MLMGYLLGCFIWLVWSGNLFSMNGLQALLYFFALLFFTFLWQKNTTISVKAKKLAAWLVLYQLVIFFLTLTTFYYAYNIVLLMSVHCGTVVIYLLFIALYHHALSCDITRQKQTIDTLHLTHHKDKQYFHEQIQTLQDEFDDKVQERTLELNIALQELEEANKTLAKITTTDELTGLNNRRYYDQKIVAECRRSRRNRTPLALIIIDIDFFKKVNDTYGHAIGDECLKLIAKQLTKAAHRSSDVACRYGGEEFCLILPETDERGALYFAENLRQTIAELTFEVQDHKLPLTISCGIALYTHANDTTTEQLFCAADKALYAAKQQGRNQVQLAQPAFYLTEVLT